ncbi:beta-lactamase-like protein [Microdochium bolleyi]|uniref:Cleavage and polyadenylation specificity factor subunit 2 n=1 Tax=Microdochium bolleyi TaxID=196109 RepID=A0A136IZI5_9PEZI|nr:beta-lactamase-like protein [Microdochium bolleyi]
MFTYTPLQGALSESNASQSVLELDGGIKVLVDVGWDDSFDVEKLKELEKQVPTISLILLTHATTEHLAAYAHCCKHFPLFTRIPVYATTPVIALGRTLLQDLYSLNPAAATTIPKSALNGASDYETQESPESSNILRQPPTYDEISTYFSLIHPLKYSQPHQPLGSPFSPPLNGLTITAYNSGHTLGGTIWHVQHGLESIVHAVDWHQGRENVYAGAAWLGGAGGGGAQVIEQLRKPTALVCSSRGGEKPSVAGGRVKRDELLLEKIQACVASGGTVLIPTDSSARILELAYLLEHAWRTDAQNADSKLKSTKLFLASRSVHSTMRYVRSMLEWMDDSIVREFEAVADTIKNRGSGQTKGAGPFDFKFMRLLDRRGQIEKILQTEPVGDAAGGRVILASDSSLEWGFSNQVLKHIAQDSRNLVILTEEPSLASPNRPSIARTLWSWLDQERQAGSEDQISPNGRELEVRQIQKEPLDGLDLANYQQWLAQQRQLQGTLQIAGTAALEAAGDVADDVSDSSSESEDDDDEQQGKALNTATTMAQATRKKAALTDEDLGINVLLKKKGVYDFDVRNKKGRDRMFPHAVRKKRADDYGELIRPEDFLRAEERAEADAADAEMDNKGASQGDLGKKRKWDDSATRGRGNQNGPKRPQFKRRGSEDADGGPAEEATHDELDEVPEDDDEAMNSPSKLVITVDKVRVNMRIDFVDFSGIHDKRSLQMLLPLIQPRKLILTSGSNDETLTLAADIKKLFAEGSVDIYTPSMGTLVDASVDTHAWVVKLAPALVKQLRWQNVRGLSIATVTGRLLSMVKDGQKAEDDAGKKRLKTEELAGESPGRVQEIAAEPTLDVVPSNLASATRSQAQPLHVGDLRLADLRKAMQQAGHTAEFRGEGTLLVDGSVVVRKTTTGRINVESIGLPTDGGPATQFGGTFYAVKKSIYESLAVVAGA